MLLILQTAVFCQATQEDPISMVQQAYQLQQSGDWAGAVRAYRAFLKIRPDEVGAHSNLGVVLAKLGHYDEAIGEYEAAEKLSPGDARISLNLSLAYEKSGRMAEAIKKLETLHAASPAENQITLLLADAYLQAGEDGRVIELLQPVEQRNPDDLAVAYLLGTSLIRKRRIGDGQVLLDRILRNGDTAEARFLLGTQMYESGDYPAAVQKFASASELNPNVPELQAYLGQALLTTGDADGAVVAFRRELGQNPNNFAANLGLGQILIVRKTYSEAHALLEHAVLLRPNDVEAMQSLGKCLNGEGKLKEARIYLEAATKANSGSAEAHQELALTYSRLAMTEEAGKERSIADRLRHLAEASAIERGPSLTDLAPDFTLPDVATGKHVSLHDFRGKSPVVLIFGSYTCPNFRSSADALKALQAKYGVQAPFLLIYIREAHGTGDWQSTRNEREGIALPQADKLGDKQSHAVMCNRLLHLRFQALLDGLDNKVEFAYHAWPSRAFLIDKDGLVRYATHLTELDFKADDLEAALRDAVATNSSAHAVQHRSHSAQRRN